MNQKKLYELPLGLYEKALPAIDFTPDSWKLILEEAKNLGFSFVELSIDESPERMARLMWKAHDIKKIIDAKFLTNMRIPSICLSIHRAHPFGSASLQTRTKAFDIMRRAVDFADALGVHVIQLAGYDIYYESPHTQSFDYFLEGIQRSIDYASGAQITLGMEIMDTTFMNSVSKYLSMKKRISSPWFSVYPDVGNISAWNGSHSCHELISGMEHTVGIHLKDTYAVTPTQKGQFRDVPFGEGCVDFKALFQSLWKVVYQGAFLMEMWAPKSTPTTFAEVMNNTRKTITASKKYLTTVMHDVCDN